MKSGELRRKKKKKKKLAEMRLPGKELISRRCLCRNSLTSLPTSW
jgi:hypothetical protein